MREAEAEALFWHIAHPLIGRLGWRLKWTNNKRQAGYCMPLRKEIRLSRIVVELNDERHVAALVCHEVAHAMSTCRHDRRWKEEAKKVGDQYGGCCYGSGIGELAAMRHPLLTMPKGPIVYNCTTCGLVTYGFRKPSLKAGRVLYCKACRMIQGVWSELTIEIEVH